MCIAFAPEYTGSRTLLEIDGKTFHFQWAYTL